MSGWAKRARQVGRKGYTLIEIAVVVGIIIVMAMVGLPFFTAMMQNSRLDGATRQLADDVREARSKATLSGWQYRILGGNAGGSSSYTNQYRLMGRSSTAIAWPVDTSPYFNFPTPSPGATQMAGPWINFNQLYPGINLNPSNSNTSFYVSFSSQGVTFESMSFPIQIFNQSGGSRQVSVTSAGSVRIQ